MSAPLIRTPAEDAARNDVAFRAVVAMADALGLSWEERCVLLGVPRTTYHRWVTIGVKHLDRDKRDRMGLLLAIYHCAGVSSPGGGGAKGWLTRANTHPFFGGLPPLARMLKGGMEDLLAVHAVARAAEALWS